MHTTVCDLLEQAAWPGGDLQSPNGCGLGGPGIDLQLEGLEE
jgi:hypothetical protein